jgi:[ribosomal protein S5]-alanine N-acetyltransferase
MGRPRPARLETPRLELRPFTLADVRPMADVLGDPVSMRFYPHPLSLEETAAWVSRNMARFERDGLGLWAITLRETGEVVGDCGAVPQVVDGAEELELGWHLHPAHQGRGYATEAAIAWRDHAFATTGRDRLISLILDENAPSRRVAERIGMTVWKTADFAGRPHLVYSVRP